MGQRHGSFVGYPGPQEHMGQLHIADSPITYAERNWEKRWLFLLLPVGAAMLAGVLVPGSAVESLTLPLLCLIAFAGGLLSTWSPCGYSSLSLLRPTEPYGLSSLVQWIPTLSVHALGYFAGGVVLAVGLAAAAWLLPGSGLFGATLAALGVLSLAYGLHQLGFVRMPYPQRPCQVSHGARLHLPMWRTGLLYGWQLGLNFVTYVRTPILYVVVAAAVLSGSVATVVLLILSLNIGRFLPMLVNALPLHDWTVQRWMAVHEQTAVRVDASVLLFGGTLLLFWGLA
jgi:hypothetical protein